MRTARHKGTRFGGGSYARRHGQGYQAVTGVVVVALAVGTLCLHHFGFGFALILAFGMTAICALTRLRATVAVYVVGASLLAGILMTPMTETPGMAMYPSAGTTQVLSSESGALDYEVYVLEVPTLDRSHLRPAPFESQSPLRSGERDDDDAWSSPLPSPDSRRIYEL